MPFSIHNTSCAIKNAHDGVGVSGFPLPRCIVCAIIDLFQFLIDFRYIHFSQVFIKNGVSVQVIFENHRGTLKSAGDKTVLDLEIHGVEELIGKNFRGFQTFPDPF